MENTKVAKYVLSPNLYKVFLDDEYFGLYNPIDQNIYFIPTSAFPIINFFSTPKTPQECKEYFPDISDVSILNKFISNRIILDYSKDNKDIFTNLGKFFSKQKPQLKVAYVILSEQCNLHCDYCFVIGATPPNYNQEHMTESMAKNISHYISENATFDNYPFHLTFYGGESLLNFPALVAICSEMKMLSDQGKFNISDLEISIVTNGCLVSHEIAQYLVDNNITVSFSIDGPKETHNSARKYKNGNGSFDDTIRGYQLCQKVGGKPNISCTIGPHNYKNIETVTNYFLSELSPGAIGFNMMRSWLFEKNTLSLSVEDATKSLLKAFSILREAGIYEDRMMRTLRSIIGNKIRPYDCAGCGDQLCFFPNGDFGPCHAFYPTRKYFYGNIGKNNPPVSESKILKQWRNRTPLLMPECAECSFITICGGGCAFEAEVLSGTINKIDKSYCKHSEMLIEWCVRDLYKNSKYINKTSNFIKV